MNWQKMRHEVFWRSIRATPLCLKAQRQTIWNGSAQTCSGKTQPSSYWCWKIPVIHAQMGTAPTSICECGVLDQTATNVILECPLHVVPRGYHGLLVLDDETRCWLNSIAANIWRGPTIGRSVHVTSCNFNLFSLVFVTFVKKTKKDGQNYWSNF